MSDSLSPTRILRLFFFFLLSILEGGGGGDSLPPQKWQKEVWRETQALKGEGGGREGVTNEKRDTTTFDYNKEPQVTVYLQVHTSFCICNR